MNNLILIAIAILVGAVLATTTANRWSTNARAEAASVKFMDCAYGKKVC